MPDNHCNKYSDLQLIEALRNRDENAWSYYLTEYVDPQLKCRRARDSMSRWHITEGEVYSELWIRLSEPNDRRKTEHYSTYEPESGIKRWTHKQVLNTISAICKGIIKGTLRGGVGSVASSAGPPIEEVEDRKACQDVLVEAEDRADLQEGMTKLYEKNPSHAYAVLFCRYSFFKHKEAANILCVSESVAKQYYSRGLKELRAFAASKAKQFEKDV
ncbi:MAG: hypothetical protein Q4G68_01340 [Planctomycetia bacterium]|nr:hypothetical protein [Planctomycetia bacterium]